MVEVCLKAVLAPALFLQAPLGRLGADFLEYLATLVVTLADSTHLRAGKGLPVAVGSEMDDAQVYAQMLPIVFWQGWRGLALGDMQRVLVSISLIVKRKEGGASSHASRSWVSAPKNLMNYACHTCAVPS